MARTRVRIPALVALSAALLLTAACGSDPASDDAPAKSGGEAKKGKPVVVVTTSWEGPSPGPPAPRT